MATNERNDFLKSLAASKSEAASIAKEAASAGFLKDDELIEALGLEEDTKKIFIARLSRFGYGKNKNQEPFFQPRFTLISPNKGTPVSDYQGLPKGPTNKEKRERAWKSIYRYLQMMGVDTTEWTGNADAIIAKTVDAADELSKQRPLVRLGLSVYQKYDSKGKPEGDPRLNISLIGLADEAEAEAAFSEEEYEDASDDVEEAEEGSEEETSEEEESSDETDYSAWVGYPCTIEVSGETIEGTTSAYDADSGNFTVTVDAYDDDWNGDYEVSPEEVTWADE